MKKKLLFLSDSVSASSGLGRITRDLAMRVHQNLGDVFEVATVGYGGNGSIKLPWQQYHLHDINGWLVPELPAVWNDFVGDEEGVLMCVWDASRLGWLGQPQTCPMPHLRQWVENAKMKKWLYGAIDAEGPLGKAPGRIVETMKGFDRVLDYSAFSSKITGNPDHLPHGIDTQVFYPRDHKACRVELINSGFVGLGLDSLMVGIVATNQARKNWQLGMETVKILKDRGHDVFLWCHVDVLERYWSLPSLIADYGLHGRVVVTTTRFSDDQMANLYSACDVTLGIGPEGFGYPIAESIFCGVPCVCGSYGAQAEFVSEINQVKPSGYYYEGAYCSKRPTFHAADWANKATEVVGKQLHRPNELDWNGPTLWSAWQKWFLEGIA